MWKHPWEILDLNMFLTTKTSVIVELLYPFAFILWIEENMEKIHTCPGFSTPVSSMTPIINRASSGGTRIRARERSSWMWFLCIVTNKDLMNGSVVNVTPLFDKSLYDSPNLYPFLNNRIASVSLTNEPGHKIETEKMVKQRATIMFFIYHKCQKNTKRHSFK